MLRRATLLLSLLLVPGVALAQTTTSTVTAAVSTSTTPTGYANRADCASTTAAATWTVATTATPSTGDKYRVATVATGTGCTTSGAVPAGIGNDVLATSATQAISSVNVNTMATMGGVSSCTGAADIQVNLCVYLLAGGSTSSWSLAAQGTFWFQLAIPPAPVVSKVTPGDTQLTAAVAPGTTTTNEQAQTGVTFTITCADPVGGTSVTSDPKAAGNIVCSGLTNGTAYTVKAVGTSQAGNPGTSFSNTVGPDASTTPQPFLDFWDVYKGQGGVEQGGCGAGGAGALAPVLALLGFLAVRRRRS